jgi:hypothetical protein
MHRSSCVRSRQTQVLERYRCPHGRFRGRPPFSTSQLASISTCLHCIERLYIDTNTQTRHARPAQVFASAHAWARHEHLQCHSGPLISHPPPPRTAGPSDLMPTIACDFANPCVGASAGAAPRGAHTPSSTGRRCSSAARAGTAHARRGSRCGVDTCDTRGGCRTRPTAGGGNEGGGGFRCRAWQRPQRRKGRW